MWSAGRWSVDTLGDSLSVELAPSFALIVFFFCFLLSLVDSTHSKTCYQDIYTCTIDLKKIHSCKLLKLVLCNTRLVIGRHNIFSRTVYSVKILMD